MHLLDLPEKDLQVKVANQQHHLKVSLQDTHQIEVVVVAGPENGPSG